MIDGQFTLAQTCMMDRDQTIQVHLAEYKALRDESDHYAQRIDRMAGIYLTALFGIAGFLLRPESQFDIDGYISSVRVSEGLTVLFMFLVLLNSVLLVRIASFFSGLLAITQYVHYEIRPNLISLTGQAVIQWDEPPRLSAKKVWIPLRFLGQGLFVIIVEAISVMILLGLTHVLQMAWPLVTMYACAWIFLLISIGSFIAVHRAGTQFHDPIRTAEVATPDPTDAPTNSNQP